MLHLFHQSLRVLCCLVLLSTANAQTAPEKSLAEMASELDPAARYASQPTQQIYERIRTLEVFMGKLAIARSLKTTGEAGAKALASLGYAPGDPVPGSEAYETEKQVLLNILEGRGTKGEALAAFSTAMFAQEAAKQLAPSEASKKLFEKAVVFWKRAGDAGDPGAYWNLAVMYQRGEGFVQSRLAAIEWDYRAGIGFLRIGEREKALAALEAIQAMDRNSALGRKLAAQLAKGAPN